MSIKDDTQIFLANRDEPSRCTNSTAIKLKLVLVVLEVEIPRSVRVYCEPDTPELGLLASANIILIHWSGEHWRRGWSDMKPLRRVYKQ